MRIEFYGGYCSGGHPVRRPWQRTLAIIIGARRFHITIGVRPANPFAIPLCGVER